MPEPIDLTTLSGEDLLGRYLQTLSARQFVKLRAELLRRLRVADAVAARLNALVDADAVGRSTPAAVAEIEVLFRLTTGAPPPQP